LYIQNTPVYKTNAETNSYWLIKTWAHIQNNAWPLTDTLLNCYIKPLNAIDNNNQINKRETETGK